MANEYMEKVPKITGQKCIYLQATLWSTEWWGPACNLGTREVRARGSYLSIAKKIRISVSVGKVVEKENSCPPLVGSVNSCITLESVMDALQMLTEPL